MVGKELQKERLRWCVATFFAILSGIWLIEDQNDVSGGRKLLALNAIIAALLTVGIYLIFEYNRRRFAKFLGIPENGAISLVVSCYRNNIEYDRNRPRQENMRYYKMKIGQKVPLIGAHDHVTGFETARIVAEFSNKLRELTPTSVVIVRDDADFDNVGPGPLICFGSPNSNFKSAEFLPSDVCEFIDDQLLFKKIHDHPYQSTADKDFGIVFAKHQQTKARQVFVCAGIDEEGTIGSSRYLLDNWSQLAKYRTSFMHLLSCDKKHPVDSKKIVGIYIDSNGNWKSD